MLAAFGEGFPETYAKANNKPSEQASKRLIMKRYQRPVFGTKRLDQIGRGDIEALKARLLAALSPKRSTTRYARPAGLRFGGRGQPRRRRSFSAASDPSASGRPSRGQACPAAAAATTSG
jgi:hypothetical protein